MQIGSMTMHLRVPCFALSCEPVLKILNQIDDSIGKDTTNLVQLFAKTTLIIERSKGMGDIHKGSDTEVLTTDFAKAVDGCLKDLVAKAKNSVVQQGTKHAEQLKPLLASVQGQESLLPRLLTEVEKCAEIRESHFQGRAKEVLKDKEIKKLLGVWRTFSTWAGDLAKPEAEAILGKAAFKEEDLTVFASAKTVFATMTAIQALWSQKLGPSQTRADLVKAASSVIASLPALEGDEHDIVLHEKLSLLMTSVAQAE